MGSDAHEPKQRSQADDTRVIPVGDQREPDETAVIPVVGRSSVGGTPEPSKFLVAQSLSAHGRDGAVFGSVSLTAERGELVVIVGDAGTGRTALLLALSGRYRQQSGTVAVAGDERPARIRRRVALACAPPAVVVDGNHTVAAVLTESALVADVEETAVRRRCGDLGLRTDSGLTFAQLSKVDQTLLVLASAWAQDVPVIAVDDLDSGVDDAGTARLWQAARFIADDDRLVLATAVRAGPAADRVVHPRPLGTDNSTRVAARESSR